MPDEELFTIRFPDGTHFQGTGQQIAEIEDDWQVELCKGEQPMDTKLTIDVTGIPTPPLLTMNADGQIIFDETSLAILDGYVRVRVQEEIEKLIPHITEQVGIRMAREARMHGNVRKK